MTKGWCGMSRMKMNLGPQHPSTHGVLRLILDVDAERIVNCEPVVGYLHRGMEKMAEYKTFLQYLPTVDRVDYVSGFFYSYAYVSAVEKLLNIQAPKRAKVIRVLLMELNRISSHLLWIGTYLLDLGAISPFFYAFRDREMILRYFEKISGQRLMYNFFTFGGVREDISSFEEVDEMLEIISSNLSDYENLIEKNPIFISRTAGVGKINRDEALAFSIPGPNLRASNSHLDFRKQTSLYEDFEFSIAKAEEGDCLARYKVRVKEIKESCRIVKQTISWLKSNSSEYTLGFNALNMKVEPKEAFCNVETPRGLATCCVKFMVL